jgi:hypothetical protein
VILVGRGTDKAARTTTRTPQPCGVSANAPLPLWTRTLVDQDQADPRWPIAGASQVRGEGRIPREIRRVAALRSRAGAACRRRRDPRRSGAAPRRRVPPSRPAAAPACARAARPRDARTAARQRCARTPPIAAPVTGAVASSTSSTASGWRYFARVVTARSDCDRTRRPPQEHRQPLQVRRDYGLAVLPVRDRFCLWSGRGLASA